MKLNKLSKAVSYRDKVYHEIKGAIINQVLKPGEQLNERMLAEKLGISRTPIREALQLLEKEGWVVTEPWKGTYVLDVTEQDIEEVFQLRMTLETLVIELVIPKITSESLAKIDEFYQCQSELGDEFKAAEFIELDRNFHMFLAELTNNKRLIQILNNISDMMRRLGVTAVQTRERYRETLAEHDQIIKALRARDLARAKQAMMYHVLRTKETVYRHWKSTKT